MNKITYCIPSKNNLRYLKNSIGSIRKNASDPEIIVYIDADNDGTEAWLKNEKIIFIKNKTNIPKGIAYGYNRCIEMAYGDVVCMFHADMFMGKGFEENMLKHLKTKVVVSATRIEPSLHPQGKEKIIQDFGMYPEDFKETEFDEFVNIKIKEYADQTTRGIFAPWLCYKKDILGIGMHDERFHSYHEDSDIFQRLILNGCNTIQSWSSFVYHLTCRGGQFQDGIENITTDAAFHTMKARSFKHFLRKWGGGIRNDEYCHPIMPHKYNIGFVVKNSTEQLVSTIEPLCSTIYVDCLTQNYIKTEQPNCYYNLSERIRHLNDLKNNDVIVSFDAKSITNESLGFLFNTLPDVLAETNETGEFEYDIFTIDIKKINCLNRDLVYNH